MIFRSPFFRSLAVKSWANSDYSIINFQAIQIFWVFNIFLNNFFCNFFDRFFAFNPFHRSNTPKNFYNGLGMYLGLKMRPTLVKLVNFRGIYSIKNYIHFVNGKVRIFTGYKHHFWVKFWPEICV